GAFLFSRSDCRPRGFGRHSATRLARLRRRRARRLFALLRAVVARICTLCAGSVRQVLPAWRWRRAIRIRVGGGLLIGCTLPARIGCRVLRCSRLLLLLSRLFLG